jgi:hypothetical protein
MLGDDSDASDSQEDEKPHQTTPVFRKSLKQCISSNLVDKRTSQIQSNFTSE